MENLNINYNINFAKLFGMRDRGYFLLGIFPTRNPSISSILSGSPPTRDVTFTTTFVTFIHYTELKVGGGSQAGQMGRHQVEQVDDASEAGGEGGEGEGEEAG